ncbi:uncharacterized protein LOC129790505 [Lutzomyia longipalpis]|uniref:uncharacterized protein LOC129790505 n=1 Tax=Lutzomyia longipalpis TaxID=7200 RepID=UPI0024844ADE|nr:uncharacterized protein LOC129790505 [Lutzomyia longipalpis]
MIRFCGCYPYQYANIYNQSRCLLSDISCLIKWKSMWDNSEPYMVNLNSHFIGTQCSDCRPQCNYIKYGIRSHFGFVQPFTPADFFNESISMDESHLSVVHVHFALPYAVEYLQTIVSTWYDLLATLGGLAGFIIGASLLSVVEFAWYASGKLCTVWFEKSPEEKLKSLPQIYLSDFKIVERRNFPMEDAVKKK